MSSVNVFDVFGKQKYEYNFNNIDVSDVKIYQLKKYER